MVLRSALEQLLLRQESLAGSIPATRRRPYVPIRDYEGIRLVLESASTGKCSVGLKRPIGGNFGFGSGLSCPQGEEHLIAYAAEQNQDGDG